VLRDGRLRVRSGATPFGQGHDTTWAMVVSERTGVPIEQIEVVHGDTDQVRSGGLTVGSRSVQIGGAAIDTATVTLIDLAKQRAADLLECAPEDVVLDTDRAVFHVAGTPARTVDWGALAGSNGDALRAECDFTPEMPTFPFGAHLAVVEVDTETGQVKHLRHVACDDAGKVLNPMLLEGQIHGGVAQGAAQALMEAVLYDEDGNPVTSNLADYAMISAAELPSVEVVHMETPTPLNPLGAKGIGESGTIGSTPAVQSAVVDAVSHLGVRHIDMPCTPMRVWQAIAAAQQ